MIKHILASVNASPYQEAVIHIATSGNPYSRANLQGHITASGLVIHENKVLLIFHPYIKGWFQPGGHIDEGESPIDAAIREVYEETGFRCSLDPVHPEIIDIDVHEIAANPKKGEGAHLHIDLLYKLILEGQSTSSEDIAWDWFAQAQVQGERISRVLRNLSSQHFQ